MKNTSGEEACSTESKFLRNSSHSVLSADITSYGD
jgi:hypothetical protein